MIQPTAGHDGRRPALRAAGGFTLIELMVVITILGLLAAIAIPTMTKFVRRTKSSEPRVQVARIFDSVQAYFRTDHVDRGDVDVLGIGGGVTTEATHKCPHPAGVPAGGAAGVPFTPNINCNLGPGGRCIPSLAPVGPGYYDMTAWTGNAMWDGLNFMQEQSHFYHYNFLSSNGLTGYGTCQFTVQAFGDLDDDGLFSTFERAGAADYNGVNAAAGLYMHLVVE